MDEAANQPPRLAMYYAQPDCWTDIQEASPRARVRVPVGMQPTAVEVGPDRKLIAPKGVIIDLYADVPEMANEQITITP